MQQLSLTIITTASLAINPTDHLSIQAQQPMWMICSGKVHEQCEGQCRSNEKSQDLHGSVCSCQHPHMTALMFVSMQKNGSKEDNPIKLMEIYIQ